MKINRQKGYFISKKEFKEINKNPFIAGILSTILGIFGVHRFYLRRKLTGFVFLVISICSLEFGEANLAAMLMFISIIEGMIYMIRGMGLLKEKILNKKHRDSQEVEQLKITIDGEKDKINIENKNVKTDTKEKTNDLEIIEVSNIEPGKISKKNESGDIVRTNWIERLSIPYERGIMEISQVKEETLKLFVHLCDYINDELKKDKNSLNRIIKRSEAGGGYYSNILYTIYCISEGHVTKVYSRNDNYYNSKFSYELLEKHLGEGLKYKVFKKAKELEENISFPNDETLKYFRLTNTGLKMEWWDRDGRFRNEREFSKEELNILGATPQRTTKVWEYYNVKKQIIELYLDIWISISSGLKDDLGWKKNKKGILEKIKSGEYHYFEDYENGNILGSLIKLSENEIREIIPNMQILNVDKEKNNIKKYLPSKLIDNINNKVTKYKDNIRDESLKEMLKDISENNPSDWKLKVNMILIEKDDKRIARLMDYSEDENFIAIAKEILKNTEDEKILLLCLYGIGREEKLSQKNSKILEDIIHPSNTLEYENIIKSKEVLSLALLERLLELKNPIRKKIELDMDKVKDSKEELSETIDIIQEYIGDEEEIEKIAIEEKVIEEKDDEKLEFKHGEFLKLVLNSGSISMEKGKQIAMDNGFLLNAFISDINQELYEQIQDQTVIIEDNVIKIDDFYVDMVKELLMNEKQS